MSTPTQDIILAAVNAAGPASPQNMGGWYNQVRMLATEITLFLNENSAMSRHVAKTLAVEKPFVAVITGGRKETSSERMLVDLVAEKGDGTTEVLRTPRVDTPEGMAMSTLVRSLKGHRVLIYKLMEEGSDKRKYRVLHHAVDLGLAPVQQQPPAQLAPVQQQYQQPPAQQQYQQPPVQQGYQQPPAQQQYQQPLDQLAPVQQQALAPQGYQQQQQAA
ncbi:hypothetical protein V5R04_07255 [Jonesiaceae bacterium BS-20]|uniref:Uncharacterized protein n=1 Tax=Jonesiaceae bacterium BS-20 TaxID=3120821 RepID=A0AAU7E0R7_9MICO